MSWLAPRLGKRLQVLEPTQTPNDQGGFTQGYNLLAEIWGGIEPIGALYHRNVQISEGATHVFRVRCNALNTIQSPAFSNAFAVGVPQIPGGLGRGVGIGFSGAFHTEPDLNTIKGSFFIKMLHSENRQRLFRIMGVLDNKEAGEYYIIQAKEILETAG